jgi:hypothetical protein
MELCEFSFSDDVDAIDAPGNEAAPRAKAKEGALA